MNTKYRLASLLTIPFECNDKGTDMSSDIIFGVWRKLSYEKFSNELEKAGIDRNFDTLLHDHCLSQFKVNVYELMDDRNGILLSGRNVAFCNWRKLKFIQELFPYRLKWDKNCFWGTVRLVAIPKERLLFLIIPLYCECDYKCTFSDFHRSFAIVCSLFDSGRLAWFTEDNRKIEWENLKDGLFGENDKSFTQKRMVPFSFLYNSELQSDKQNAIHSFLCTFGNQLTNMDIFTPLDKDGVAYRPDDAEYEGMITRSGVIFATCSRKIDILNLLDKHYWTYLASIIQETLLESISDKLTISNADGDISNRELMGCNSDMARIRGCFMQSSASGSYESASLYKLFNHGLGVDGMFSELTERLNLLQGVKSQKSRFKLQVIQGSITWFMLFFAVIPTVNDAIGLSSKSPLFIAIILVGEVIAAFLMSLGLNRLTFLRGEM